MHSALQISELLHHIFQNLNLDPGRGNRHDLLSCSLACKGFSEAALDVMWENLPSVTLLPFASPLEYDDLLNSNRQYAEAYFNHLERLKFYGKRVRTMRIHSKLTPRLLKCIVRLRDIKSYDIKPDDSTPPPIMSMIFPGLTTLSLVLSGTNPNDDLNEMRIRMFLLPTVKNLSLHCSPGASHEGLATILRLISSVKPRLTSLTLGREVISGFSRAAGELDSELCRLIQALPRLESLSLPLSMFTAPILVVISSLLELEKLNLAFPLGIQSKLSAISNPFRDFHSATLQHGAFFNLRFLEINTHFDDLHEVLYAHSSLTSHITHLSLTSTTLSSRFTMERLFPSSLSSSSLPFLTHLSLVFVSSFPIPGEHGLVASFLKPLFAAPCAHHLTFLLVEHEAPLNLNDEEYDEIARRLPSIEFLRFEVSRHRLPRIVLQSQQRGIRASLAALVSFLKHCPKLREISLTVDAETRPVPVVEVTEMPLGAHAVKIDMSISPVGEYLEDVATFFARHFFCRRSELTSCLLDFAEGPNRPMIHDDEDTSTLLRERQDSCVTYALRWKAIGEMAHKGEDS